MAIDAMAAEDDLPVLGVILPGAHRAADESASGRIGVIGTRATVGSGAYEKAIRARRGDAKVLSLPCPLFVPLADQQVQAAQCGPGEAGVTVQLAPGNPFSKSSAKMTAGSFSIPTSPG